MTWLLWLILGVCCIFCICSSLVPSGIKKSLNQSAEQGTISGSTPSFWGMCPDRWTKTTYTNGSYCIQPGSIGRTDASGNLVDAIRADTCPGKTATINGHTYCLQS